jgi:class 3 adenylate cyclase/tetratricopeptide (TPR) repeat protein
MACPSCRAEVPAGARFCPSCGHPLAGGTSPAGRSDERRIVTVLFADLVGFTALSEARDPEQVKNLIDRCFSRLVVDIEAFGGMVDKIVGDAIVALFGAPTAHEDDAERAVRAALQMQQTIADMGPALGAPVRLRIGVNTGEVLVGALRAGGDSTVMGDVVNVAQRLQTLAGPGEVVVGPSTHGATRGVLDYEPLGTVQVKGREEPVDAYRAVCAVAPPGHRPRRVKAPLVGRDEELGVLCNGLTLALTRNRGHLALLLGEAGIGKTRLAEELATKAVEDFGARVLEGRCLPYGEANVWWPVAEAVRQACEIGPDDDDAATAAKCRAAVASALDVDAESDDASRVADGLRYLMGSGDALADVDPTRAREDAVGSLLSFVEGLASRRPLVLVLSELHWADTLVLEMADALMDRVRHLPFVLVGTARPELEERWTPAGGRFNQVVIHLDPLPPDAARQLLAALLGDEPPADLRDLLLERSGGNPFFLEELVALLGDDVRPSELPATLRGLVAARLDALPARERAVLEDAAVVGRAGRRVTVAALAKARGDEGAESLMDDLVSKDLLTLDDGAFEFRSELVREVAYETLTKAERARRHALVGSRFEARLKETDRHDEYLEHLAHHYGMAAELVCELGVVDGVPDDINHRALMAIEQAAIRAKKREVPRASLRLLDLAMRLLPDEAEDHRRLVHMERAKVKTTLRDLPGARDDLADGMALARAAGDDCDVARGLVIRGEIEQKEGDLAASEATLTEAVDMARPLGVPRVLGEALRQRGMTRLFGGDPIAAEGDIVEALDAARAAGARQEEAWALWSLAWNAFVQSRLADAEERLREALGLFTEIGDWGAADWARGLLGWVRFFQGRRAEAEELALSILDKSRQAGDRWALAMTLVLLSGVRLWEGRTDEAIEPAREAVALFRQIDDTRGRMQATASLARALAASGRVAEARSALDGLQDVVAYDTPGEVQVGMMLAGTMLFTGNADAALETLVREGVQVNVAGDLGRSEGRTLVGLALLQTGDARQAVDELQSAADQAPADGPRANALATLGLARVCVGEPQCALDAVEAVPGIEAATYLDRSMASAVRGFALAQLGRADEAADAFDAALSMVDATGDRMMQAVLRLAAAEGLGRPDLAEEARRRLAVMGVDGAGWHRAFSLAASAISRAGS